VSTTEFFSTFGIGTLASTVVVLLAKTMIEQVYARKLEDHKAQINTELEHFRADRRIDLAQRTFRYSHVFERTEATIVKTYQPGFPRCA
jgi:hypothetical protein